MADGTHPQGKGLRPAAAVVYLWDADYPWDVRTEKVCTSLTGAGYAVHIVARNRKWAARHERLPEATVDRMRPWRWVGKRLDALLGFPAFFNPRWIAFVTRAVRRVRPKVIIVRDLPLCPTALMVGRLFRTPVVLDMAENYPAMMQEIWDAGRNTATDFLVRNPRVVAAVERYCVAKVDRVIVVVDESGDRLIRMGVPRERIVVVSNTPPRMRVERAADAIREPSYRAGLELVYLGLMEIPRGVMDVLDAVAQLRAAGHPVTCRLVGDGRDRQLFEEHARKLNLTSANVEFLGWLPYAEALKVIASADVGIVPHHADEAWNSTVPNKLFDYMAAGIPVISSDAIPSARLVRETEAGLVFQSGDARALAGAIERMMDFDVRSRMSSAGRDAVLNVHNWESATSNLLSMMDSLEQGKEC